MRASGTARAGVGCRDVFGPAADAAAGRAEALALAPAFVRPRVPAAFARDGVPATFARPDVPAALPRADGVLPSDALFAVARAPPTVAAGRGAGDVAEGFADAGCATRAGSSAVRAGADCAGVAGRVARAAATDMVGCIAGMVRAAESIGTVDMLCTTEPPRGVDMVRATELDGIAGAVRAAEPTGVTARAAGAACLVACA